MRYLSYLNSIVTDYFTFWIILFSLITFLRPEPFAGLTGLIVPVLGIIMFGMGMTLTVGDFRRIAERPRDVAIGAAAQYGIMPLTGFILAKAFSLDPVLAAGVVLVGSCPGGTASNVITYLARGDVALSVTMTSVTTLLAPLMIPFFMYVYAGQWIHVPALDLFISTVEIILLPVALGVGLRLLLGKRTEYVLPVLPGVSSLSIIFIVGVIVAANAASIAKVGAGVAVIVMLHNVAGLALGYSVARLSGMDVTKARAVSIEVGMQNSGLAVALANLHLSALAALPAAVFSVWHNISGSAIAWWWRRHTA
ncbi:MAG TPA: bile acid:sodium symporter family protein [Thermodesulfobacteriota bacterium]|nr:bile acid:sodium symporter family protein [Thermodesulfobacteriota bacterium]